MAVMQGKNISPTPNLIVEKVSDDLWRIVDSEIVSLYLIAGETRAVLIDTGWGIGNLPSLVSECTNLPLTVVNTHGHADHVYGNYQFGEVLIHTADEKLMREANSPKNRGRFSNLLRRQTFKERPSEETWINVPPCHVTSFQGSTTLDLGDRVLEIIDTPGHTPGSVCVYDNRDHLLFSADNLMAGNTMLTFDESLSLGVFKESMERLAAIEGKIDQIYPSHGPVPLEPAVIKEMRDGLANLLDGGFQGTPTSTPFASGLACSFGICGVMYREPMTGRNG